ncbi:MAG TPA: rod-binding protein [Caulobacteraceae bacterium]|nr:rod-binding protein [Caulobacteraceae bacterium]
MSALQAQTAPVNLLLPTPAAPAAPQNATKAKIAQAAQAFESQFIAQMLEPMFEGISSEPPFGGGASEQAFRSFLLDAIGDQVARSGGVGIAQSVQHEMLKLQGMT